MKNDWMFDIVRGDHGNKTYDLADFLRHDLLNGARARRILRVIDATVEEVKENENCWMVTISVDANDKAANDYLMAYFVDNGIPVQLNDDYVN